MSEYAGQYIDDTSTEKELIIDVLTASCTVYKDYANKVVEVSVAATNLGSTSVSQLREFVEEASGISLRQREEIARERVQEMSARYRMLKRESDDLEREIVAKKAALDKVREWIQKLGLKCEQLDNLPF